MYTIEFMYTVKTLCTMPEQAMTRFAIAHTYEESDGDHTNTIGERIEIRVLPFFSSNLSFTTKASTTASTRR